MNETTNGSSATANVRMAQPSAGKEREAGTVRKASDASLSGLQHAASQSDVTNKKITMKQVTREQASLLHFDIDSWSSYSANYHPEQIKVHRPNDQASRWSSAGNNQMQFLTLKLQKLSIVSKLATPTFLSTQPMRVTLNSTPLFLHN